MLWAVFTIVAAAAQTVRNAMQRSLTASLGTVGATHVRFLFGLPFSILFLIGVTLVFDRAWPSPPPVFWPWVLLGAAAQFIATALMLAAMGERSFVVTIAYIKTEPVQVALFGFILLGDKVTWPMALAIVIATAGVVLMSVKPGTSAAMFTGNRDQHCSVSAPAPVRLVCDRFPGAILSLEDPNFVMAATFTLVVGLLLQSILLTPYLYLRRPRRSDGDRESLAAVAVRRLHGRVRLAVLVSRLRHRDGGERPHAGAGRGVVRAGDLVFHLQTGHDAA
jgi:drug/metabolite transporter (DMT)-like permease